MTQPYVDLPLRKALVSLGSNVTSSAGSPVQTLDAAISSLDHGPCEILARSRFFSSPFVPKGAQPDVINAVVEVATRLPADAFLAFLHEIEAKFDRERPERWTSRTLDLDLLTMDQKIAPDQSTLREWVELPPEKQPKLAPKTLILPHPRLQDRAFVLVPAAEIAPEWRHPLTGRTIREMLDALPPQDVAAMTPLVR